MTPREIHDKISELAYLMWETAGRQQGAAMQYWLAAERQILAMMGTAMGTAMDRIMAPCRAAPQLHQSRKAETAMPAPTAGEAAPSEAAPSPAAEQAPVEAPALEPSDSGRRTEEPLPADTVAVEPAPPAPETVEPTAVVQPETETAASAPPSSEPASGGPGSAEPAPVPTEPATPVAEAVPGAEPAPVVDPGAKAAGNGELIEQRNRPIVRRDWIGRNVTLELDTPNGHYRVPHDALWGFVKAHKTVESTKTWQQKGEYSWPKIPHDLLDFLSAYASE